MLTTPPKPSTDRRADPATPVAIWAGPPPIARPPRGPIVVDEHDFPRHSSYPDEHHYNVAWLAHPLVATHFRPGAKKPVAAIWYGTELRYIDHLPYEWRVEGAVVWIAHPIVRQVSRRAVTKPVPLVPYDGSLRCVDELPYEWHVESAKKARTVAARNRGRDVVQVRFGRDVTSTWRTRSSLIAGRTFTTTGNGLYIPSRWLDGEVPVAVEWEALPWGTLIDRERGGGYEVA